MPRSAGEPSVPEFLSAFDASALAADSRTLVAVDATLRIVWLNPSWTSFALRNGGDRVLERFGIGSGYLDGIAGEQRALYESFFRDVLDAEGPEEALYECSSADLFRRYRLRVLPFSGKGLLLEHTLVEERAHEDPPARTEDAAFRDSTGMITQCGNCRRIRHPIAGSWHWVPSWVEKPERGTSHGVCPVCFGYYYASKLRRAQGRRR